MKLYKNIFFFFLIFIINSAVFSQTINIKGRVYCEKLNEPLPGVYVSEKYTSNNTFTDANGNFSLSVKDTSLIYFSYISCKDTILPAKELINAKLILKKSDEQDIIICYAHTLPSYSFGLFGDVNYFPFGTYLYTFQPRLFFLSGGMYYKTDFKTGYDLKFSLNKYNVINKKNYSLKINSSFQKKRLSLSQINYKVQDFQLSAGNNLKNIIGFDLGLIYRKEKIYDIQSYFGFYTSVYKYFKIGLQLSGSYSYYSNYSEYSFAVYQELRKHLYVYSRWKVGIIYNKYNLYQDISFLLSYTINH